MTASGWQNGRISGILIDQYLSDFVVDTVRETGLACRALVSAWRYSVTLEYSNKKVPGLGRSYQQRIVHAVCVQKQGGQTEPVRIEPGCVSAGRSMKRTGEGWNTSFRYGHGL